MSDPAGHKAVTYSSYLAVDELLQLQRPLSDGPEHDEMLFIVIHQVYELWFKQVLHEAAHLSAMLQAGRTNRTLHTLKRILTIFKTLVGQIDVLETMTPINFNSFRDRLASASGFQSAQFRELEFVLGHKRPGMIAHHPEGSRGRARLEALLGAPSLWDHFLRYLVVQGHALPRELLERDVTAPHEPSEAVQEVLLTVYREDKAEAMVCERLLDLDEAIQEWRYRHVKMVERTIGGKIGTGGSEGAEYLRRTLFQPLFPDLWLVRDRL